MNVLVLVLLILQTAIVHSSDSLDKLQKRYDYGIDSEGDVFEGFVYEDVFKGSYIEVSKTEGEIIKEGAKSITYLRIILIKGDKHMIQNGIRHDIIGTDAFEINEEGYVIVNSTEELLEEKEIQFYVVLVKEPEAKIVSNPIPFIVRLKVLTKQEENYPAAAAIFAGVLILVIVVMALFIPFVVRAKRRFRSGKPMFKPGSHDMDENGKNDFKRVESKEPNWYHNTEFKYEEEVEKERDEFTHDILDMTRGASNGTESIQLSQKRKLDWINPHADTDKVKTGILKNGSPDNVSDAKL